MNLKYTVDKETSGKPVKYVLKYKLELSERLIKKLKYDGKVLCNSLPVYVNKIVEYGDVVEVNIDFVEECSDIIPENIDIDIIYEDDYFLALNKQPHIVVHPTSSHPSGTIANAIMYRQSLKGISKKIRPVSRLDRDTSGVIVFAKNEYIQEALIRQMTDKTFLKEYIGVVHGKLSEASGTIDLPIERKPGSIMLRHISSTGEKSITHFEVLEYFENSTLVKFQLETGRTHQIRVHCQAIGHPLIGDTLYTFDDICVDISYRHNAFYDSLIGRQALHSHITSFIHPVLKTPVRLTAPVPRDIQSLLEILRK